MVNLDQTCLQSIVMHSQTGHNLVALLNAAATAKSQKEFLSLRETFQEIEKPLTRAMAYENIQLDLRKESRKNFLEVTRVDGHPGCIGRPGIYHKKVVDYMEDGKWVTAKMIQKSLNVHPNTFFSIVRRLNENEEQIIKEIKDYGSEDYDKNRRTKWYRLQKK